MMSVRDEQGDLEIVSSVCWSEDVLRAERGGYGSLYQEKSP